MKINLRQSDIEQALKMYLTSQGIVLQDRSFEATFKAGRKGSGFSADVSIGTAVVKLPKETEKLPAVVEPTPVEATVTPTPIFTPEAEVHTATPEVVAPVLTTPPIEVPVTPQSTLSMLNETAAQVEPTPTAVKPFSLFA